MGHRARPRRGGGSPTPVEHLIPGWQQVAFDHPLVSKGKGIWVPVLVSVFNCLGELWLGGILRRSTETVENGLLADYCGITSLQRSCLRIKRPRVRVTPGAPLKLMICGKSARQSIIINSPWYPFGYPCPFFEIPSFYIKFPISEIFRKFSQ
jgi:hypothetical protein